MISVLHLVGSAVSEEFADLSRLYAAGCLDALRADDRYEHHIAYVTPDGCWRFPAGLDPGSLALAEPLPLADAVARITDLAPDVAVPQMFCRPGMTVYRGLLDVLGVAYVGNPPDVMALGADKARARDVVAGAGVAVPEGEVLRHGEIPGLDPPAVVKPVDADNSVGVSLVLDRRDYPAALAAAFGYSDRVLVERYVELGREVRCGVLERDGELVCLPLEEYAVDAASKPVRDAADKLRRRPDGELELVAKDAAHAWIVDPAEPADPATWDVWDAAIACHLALGCRDYSLFDFRIDPQGRPWFLEAGLYCSFAPSSVVTVMAGAAGIDLPDLFATAVDQALARHRSRRG